MTTPLQATAIAHALDTVLAMNGQRITLGSGETARMLTAAVGRTQFLADPGQAGAVGFQSRDYLVRAADLTTGGVLVEPQPGTPIIEADGRIYEVLPAGEEPCWRWMDPYHVGIRIHSKEVAGA